MSRLAVVRLMLAIQVLAALVIANSPPHSNGALHGILAGQAALVGVAFGASRLNRTWRVWGAAIGGALLAMGAMNGGGGWEFLLLCVRTVVVGMFFSRAFRRRGIFLTTEGEPFTEPLLRVPLRAFFILTLGVALFFGLGAVLDRYGNIVLLVAWVALLGAGYAVAAILAALAPLEPRASVGKLAVYALMILALAAANGGVAYWQTDRWTAARTTFVAAVCEAAWVVGTLAVMRACGFRLAAETEGSA